MFYCYVYLNPQKAGRWCTDNVCLLFEPFYVGKGKGNRYKHHLLKHNLSKHSHKAHTINNLLANGIIPPVVIFFSSENEAEALHCETEFIKSVGTRSQINNGKRGPLTNLKLSGNEQQYSDESRTKMSEKATIRQRRKHSPETIAKMKMSESNKTAKARARTSALFKGKKLSSERCDALSKIHKGKTISEEHRKLISDKLKGRKFSNSRKAEMSNRQKLKWIIEYENNLTEIVNDLHLWCDENKINYNSLYGTLHRNKWHKGFKLKKYDIPTI